MSVLLSEYSSSEAQARVVAAIVAGQLAQALHEAASASLAVPGGETPRRFLSILGGAGIDWANVTVMPTDERLVEADSNRSNARMLSETLFAGEAGDARFLSFLSGADPPADPHKALSRAIRACLPLDVCVLGMGVDKHVASLFPGGDRLDVALAPRRDEVLCPIRAPNAPEARLTLTAPVLRSARHIHLLIRGPDKLAAFEAAETGGDTHRAPVRAILSAPGDVTVHYTREEDPA